jgi:ABC-2 type transport system permease protein
MPMGQLVKRFVRSAAFIGKEFNEVRRQPRLILALILGPFLILLLFGIGYVGENAKLSAIVVVPRDTDYSRDPAEYARLTGDQLIIHSVSDDENSALNELQEQKVDLVVVVPGNVGEQISSGAQVALPVYLNEIDPVRRQSVSYLTYFYANEINKQTVAAAARGGQESAGDLRSVIVRMRNSLDVISRHIASGQLAQASAEGRAMQGQSSQMVLTVALIGQLTSSDTTLIKPAQPQDPRAVNLTEGREVAEDLTEALAELNQELTSPQPDTAEVQTRISAVRSELDSLDRLTQQFQALNPLVLAAPFYAYPQNRARSETNFTTFYGPGVLVLLLQHIGVTLGALSMVRERLLGTVELFRVSPVSSAEIMVGKYVSFLLILGTIAAVLVGLLANNLEVAGFPLSLGVPLLGDPWLLVLTIGLTIFASVGLGFVISGLSKSESQAVQLAMLILLTSVFFSGFFLSLEALWEPVRGVSYALPVTHGIAAMQDIMLRGVTPDAFFLLMLAGLGILFAVIAYLLFRREFHKG